MPNGKLTLITGRSTEQGIGISTGKSGSRYRSATTIVQLSASDMGRFGLHDGDTVRLRSRFGEATATCHAEDLPEGLAFMAFGPATSQLTGDETHASGMPDGKALEVELERVPA
jgi:formylmethanofuran dehydrogenase subunit D